MEVVTHEACYHIHAWDQRIIYTYTYIYCIIESLRIRWAHCALPTIICPQFHKLSIWMLGVLVLLHIQYSPHDYHLIEWKYWPRQASGRWLGIWTPTRLTRNRCQIRKRLFSKSYLSILLARRSYGSANKYDNLQHSVHSLVMSYLSPETRRRSEETHCRTCATRPRNLVRAQTLWFIIEYA